MTKRGEVVLGKGWLTYSDFGNAQLGEVGFRQVGLVLNRRRVAMYDGVPQEERRGTLIWVPDRPAKRRAKR